MTFRRLIARLIERASGNYVVAPKDLLSMPERLHLTRLFKHYAVDCVFDVGANDGQYARFLRRSVGYRGPIISYEPIPELARRMAERATAEGDKHWHVEALALDREAGQPRSISRTKISSAHSVCPRPHNRPSSGRQTA